MTIERVINLVAVKCEKLRDAFEGREAILLDKGVLRVRVRRITPHVAIRCIYALLEEIPTPGLERSLFHMQRPEQSIPLRLDVTAGYLSRFSRSTWCGGYTPWNLFFSLVLVADFMDLAAEWPAEVDAMDRYLRAASFLGDHPETLEETRRVFPD